MKHETEQEFSLSDRVTHFAHEIELLRPNATAFAVTIKLPDSSLRTRQMEHLIRTSRMMICALDQLVDMIEDLHLEQNGGIR